jgi:hypothetical protein
MEMGGGGSQFECRERRRLEMWINSPLGRWEQNARVETALGAAERMRPLEGASGDDAEGRLGGMRILEKVKLPWQAVPVNRAADAMRSILIALHVKVRESRQAAP